MKCLIFLLLCTVTLTISSSSHLVCYYDGSSSVREDLSKLTLIDLELALQFCTHLVYGYAGINSESNKLVSNNEKIDLDVGNGLYRKVTNMKKKYPHLKILLSVGGDMDLIDFDDNKYLTLLESSTTRASFVKSAHSLLKAYAFDGLDLAWQFPKNKVKKVHGSVGKIFSGFKKIFGHDQAVDEKSEEHKEQFTALVREIKNTFSPDGLLLELTVLPNINSSLYYDVPVLITYLDYINLLAYDFTMPDRNPGFADFSAPIYELSENEYRNTENNMNYQVQYWLNNRCPATKIHVGVAAWGRAWKMTKDSGLTGVPPIYKTDGPGPGGQHTQTPGLLSWSEVCSKLPSLSNQHLKGADAPLHKVIDSTKRFGNYAYRSADNNGDNGLWVSYEDPDTAAIKTTYAKSKGLGGIALIDLSFDDFRGTCSGHKYPILRAIKYRL